MYVKIIHNSTTTTYVQNLRNIVVTEDTMIILRIGLGDKRWKRNHSQQTRATKMTNTEY